MFKKGEKVLYYAYADMKEPSSVIEIENVYNGMAMSTSGSFGDMGPFLMKFDAESGEGLELYEGAKIEKLESEK